jgi:micrococcal nuclease
LLLYYEKVINRIQLATFFVVLTGMLVLALLLIALDPPPLPAWQVYTVTSTSPAPSLLPVAPASPIIVPSPLASPAAQLFRVIKVVDGDTIKVDLGGTTETVRLVGINAPESVDPRKPVECMGLEASQYLANTLTNQLVRLELDPTQSERDRYGRLLRFVFLPDGTDAGLKMIVVGFAQEAMYSAEPHQYRSAYLEAQQTAQGANQGLRNKQICP